MLAQRLLITDSELPAVKVYQQNRGWGTGSFFLPLHEQKHISHLNEWSPSRCTDSQDPAGDPNVPDWKWTEQEARYSAES